MRLVVKEGLRNKVRALSEAMQHSGTPLLVLDARQNPSDRRRASSSIMASNAPSAFASIRFA